MGQEQTGGAKPYDAVEAFRAMRDAYLDAMAKTMVETVNTEGYAQASGAMLDATLTMSAPFREAMEKSMLQVLQQLSLPSRQDIISLAERFTNFEMRLDDLDAKLDRMAKPAAPPTPATRPVKSAGSRAISRPVKRTNAKAASTGKRTVAAKSTRSQRKPTSAPSPAQPRDPKKRSK